MAIQSQYFQLPTPENPLLHNKGFYSLRILGFKLNAFLYQPFLLSLCCQLWYSGVVHEMPVCLTWTLWLQRLGQLFLQVCDHGQVLGDVGSGFFGLLPMLFKGHQAALYVEEVLHPPYFCKVLADINNNFTFLFWNILLWVSKTINILGQAFLHAQEIRDHPTIFCCFFITVVNL